jgi:cobalamin biosynthesis protein CobT
MVGDARRLLQVMTRKRAFYNQKKGRLDTSKLYRVCNPESSLSERIFKQKQDSQALDTAVSILVDYSGSMGNRKIVKAIAGAIALEQLCKMLRINCEIAGFTEYSSQKNYHFIFKNYNQPVGDDRFLENMTVASRMMNNNADGDNILVAWNRLMQQRNRRKVLIVLSDGSPAADRGDAMAFTQKVVKGIEDRHDTDIIGIGINDDNVSLIYKNHKVINNISELPKALIDTLEFIVLH